MKEKIILAFIIILGLFLRIIWINNSPPALYGDELTIALDSYSLLQTGQDQLGNFFPLTFQMGAGRPAGYVYGSIPFVAVFGPTALGVRALSILSGLGIIILLYYIGRKLFSKKIGLAATFIASVSPWDISLSRGGFEAHFALFVALLGFYFFLKAKEKPIFYIFSALSFGLTLHTYPTYKVTLLLFLPLLFWYQGSKNVLIGKDKKYFLVATLLFFILGVAALSQTFITCFKLQETRCNLAIIGGSEERFSNINIFSKNELKDSIEQKINFERSITDLPQSISKYFHNKPVEYTKVLIENYLQNFSLDFLILHGDRNPRHNMATIGEIYLVEVIFIFIGLLTFWQKNKRVILFLISWLVLAPIPTAIVDLPHALRSSFMQPPLVMLSALGLATILSYKNKILLSLVLLIFMIQFIFFVQKLYFLAPNEYSNFWSYSAKLASEIVNENKDDFNYILLSDRIDSIEFAYPVYAKVDPRQIIYQNRNKTLLNDLTFKKFDNVYIGNIPSGNVNSFLDDLDGPVLFVGPPEAKESFDSAETITGIDDRSALIIKKITNE